MGDHYVYPVLRAVVELVLLLLVVRLYDRRFSLLPVVTLAQRRYCLQRGVTTPTISMDDPGDSRYGRRRTYMVGVTDDRGSRGE